MKNIFNEKRELIISAFEEFYADEPASWMEASSDLFVSLCYLSMVELDQVIEAIYAMRVTGVWDKHWGSIGHDIHGLASRDSFFLPRIVGHQKFIPVAA